MKTKAMLVVLGSLLVTSAPGSSPHAVSRLLQHGLRCSGYVALTFDDGPSPVYTSQVLRVFATSRDAAGQRIRGTFFLVGARAQNWPDLVSALAAARNEVGNHSYSHPFMDELPPDAAENEILGTNQILSSITHQQVLLYRPPFARTTTAIESYVRTQNMTTALWTVDSRDWAGATAVDIATIGSRAKDGDIVLLHDSYASVVSALPQMLERLRTRGLCPGKVMPTDTPTVTWYGADGTPMRHYVRAAAWPVEGDDDV